MKYLLMFALIVPVSSVFAIDQAKCSRMLNKGWWKTYEYAGIDQPLTKATKKHGTTKSTFVTSTEGSTAVTDPGYSSNVSSSGTQGTSSFGDCSLIGLNKVKESREMYFAINRDEIIDQIAVGNGEHLDVLAAYSMCDANKVAQFKNGLQANTAAFLNPGSSKFGELIDQSVANNSSIKGSCHTYY